MLVMRGEVTRRPDSSHAVSVDCETYAALHAPPRSPSESLVSYRESDLLAGDMLEVYVVNGYQGVRGSIPGLGYYA